MMVVRIIIAILPVMMIGACSIDQIKRLNRTSAYIDESMYCPAVAGSQLFAVVPFNSFLDQEQFAMSVQGGLVSYGLSVVEVPRGIKEVEEKTMASQGALLDGSSGSQGGGVESIRGIKSIRTVRYKVMEELDAAYVVETSYIGSKRGMVKFVDVKSRTVMGVYRISSSSESSLRSDLLKALISIGVVEKKATSNGSCLKGEYYADPGQEGNKNK